MGPEKLLLLKLMERREGIWERASMSMVPERERSVRWRLLMTLLTQMTPTQREEQGFWSGTQEGRVWGSEKDFFRLRRAWLSERGWEGGRRERRRRKKNRRTAAIAVPEILCVRERNGPLLGKIEVL
ncbi:hypothetical protein V8G54_014126 [Vigna mungo]|uniref:Uncharacterized protein n=1 Tax=Vigna mungo TaxID=3915 RepID=A0AAQ3NGZ5_VIGMU